MKSGQAAGKVVGVLFILAAVSSIAGLVLYDPILSGSDYLNNGAAHANQVILGALMELILVVSAIGTSITMFPFLRRYNESLALGHVCFRFMEAVIIIIGIVSMLALLTMSQEYAANGAADEDAYLASGTVLHAVHDWTFLLGPNFMLGINTMMYSYIFYRTKLVPRYISILGMTGATLVFAASLLEMFGAFAQVSVWGALLSLPVAANEMILAVWLIVKGFNRSAPAQADPNPKGSIML
ncbi:DUF4386 domain-containing protein [Paenibacillus rhizovicinus]|uniref:DUF4386 domain-containing protein n=1 Tax=Paenibacillus rhizovicinus TaxID=2704463 RepID=A0A6C0P4Y8_9BACL|nr:DUF4386 domain-containing protein [Paenibacillus rhizovicinus]QHW33559.1 DUF4386 domain-containing protein [Paenibacillus rhizovicinus]